MWSGFAASRPSSGSGRARRSARLQRQRFVQQPGRLYTPHPSRGTPTDGARDPKGRAWPEAFSRHGRIVGMAQRTVILFEDDLDGGEAAGTVRFSLDGVEYEIDLSEKNAATLRGALERYVQAGRRIGGRRAVGASAPRVHSGGATKTDPAQLAAIRDWARRRGLEVKNRGRIPAEIVAQYNADTAPAQVEPPAKRSRAKNGLSDQPFSNR